MYKAFGLLLILALAFYTAFIPHIGYAYPLHVDEWMHMTYAETIAQTGSITGPDPFTGMTDIKLGDNLWVGFHIFWAMFQQVSGIPWISLFRYFPSLIFMITVLAVYILASRQGFGLEAAFFTCLIPTTGGLLGPAFMVPMALAMLFIPLALFVAFNLKNWPSYLLIFLFTCFLLISHATTAIVLCVILTPYILMNIKDNWRHSVGILAALILPFALSLPWTFHIAVQTAQQLAVPQYFSPYIELPDLLWKYGLLPMVFSFIGTVILIIKGGKKNLGLVLGLALLLIVLLVFIRFHYGISTVYERGLTAMLLILSIMGGAGLFWLRNLKLPANFLNKHKSYRLRNSTAIACVFLVIIMLIIAIPTRLNASFYHMIDDEDYRAFTWIKDNVGAAYSSAVVDPWKATAFTAISRKKTVHRIWVNQESVDDVIYKFLENGCKNTAFFTNNKVSFAYNRAPCNNPELIEVRGNIYITNPNISNLFTPHTAGLQNGNFEEVRGIPPSFWSNYTRNCKPVFMYPEVGRENGWCVGIKVLNYTQSSEIPLAIWLQNIPVQSGESYLIGGWIKTDNVEGQGGAMIVPQWRGSGDVWISLTPVMPYIKGTNGWTYYQGSVTAPPGAITCTLSCMMAECTGTSWYDDLLFKQE